MERNIIIRAIIVPDMPETIHGASYPDKGGYTIMLNGSDTEERREESFLHECRHIWRGDHARESAADDIERQTHRKAG